MAGVNVGVRVAEILRGLQTARTGGGLAREATMEQQALRGFQDGRGGITNIVEDALQGRGRINNLNTGAGKYLASEAGKDMERARHERREREEEAQQELTREELRKKRLLTRADDFNKHFNISMARYEPRYREVVNVENKNSIDDVKGLQTAYARNTGLFKQGNTLYISGTGGKSGFSSKVNDIFSDIFLIPTHNVQFSDKYRDVMAELEKHPDVTRLVGHSLGSSVLQEINNRNNQKYITTTYNAPFISFGNRQKNPHALRFSNKGDLISALDRNAIKVETGTINPSEAHKFKNMTTQGSFEQGVDDSAQVARNIQIQNWNK